jgi:phytoene dehydrogenase-like protein
MLKFIQYGVIDVNRLARRFKDPFLSFAIAQIFGGIGEFTSLGLMFTLANMHKRNAAYPVGGSFEFIKPIEARFKGLGGEVMYNGAVERIMTEGGRAEGVLLKNGTVVKADIVISAADGHATIYDMLGGKFRDNNIDSIYSGFKRFPSIVQVSMGVAMDLAGEPQSIDFPLAKPISAGTVIEDRMSLRVYAFDRTFAPEGCTALTTYLGGDYEYWTGLKAKDKKKYEAEKKRVGDEVVDAVDKKYPGFKERVEVIDVATPATYVEYTGNWMGSFEGWLMTPGTMMKKIPRTLPGLKNFHMIGQWVAPGGGLPSGLMTGKDVIKTLCKEDGKEFRAEKP